MEIEDRKMRRDTSIKIAAFAALVGLSEENRVNDPSKRNIYFDTYPAPDKVCAKNLSVEIGYYVGDLPEMIRSTVGDGVFGFIDSDELWLVYTRQAFSGERVLQISVKGVLIPVDAHPDFPDV